MSCLYSLLSHLNQYIFIIFGFNYFYIDFKKSHVKIYKSVKIYVVFVTLLFGGLLLFYFFDAFILHMHFTPLYLHVTVTHLLKFISHVVMLMTFILLRIREETAFKRLHKMVLKLQTTYFDKLSDLPLMDTIKRVTVINMFLILITNFCSILDPIIIVLRKLWFWQLIASYCYGSYFEVMEQYILFQHSLIICYINNYFRKLNNHLKCMPVGKRHARIYLQLSLILKEVNAINGSIVLIAIVSIVFEFAKYFHYTLSFELHTTWNYRHYLDIFDVTVCSTGIFLYFLNCENLKNTTKETGLILMEQSEMEDYKKLETFCFGRLMMELDVKIYGFLTIDLSALFSIVSAFVTLTIILIQVVRK
ncbi:uncharacterized protein ACRADG_005240 [Cochliomyia hominivorax]